MHKNVFSSHPWDAFTLIAQTFSVTDRQTNAWVVLKIHSNNVYAQYGHFGMVWKLMETTKGRKIMPYNPIVVISKACDLGPVNECRPTEVILNFVLFYFI